MKPTKEQLADHAWWRRNTESTDNYVLWSKERLSLISLENYINDIDGYELLAKRPEPEQWKPKAPSLPDIGTEVEIIDNGSLVYGQGESGEVIGHIENCAIVRMSYGLGCFEASYLKIKKTQREELIDIIKCTCADYEEVADSILARFDLTKKESD